MLHVGKRVESWLRHGIVDFFPDLGHEAKATSSLDPVALAIEARDDLVDSLATKPCFVRNFSSREIPRAARPYGIEHSGFVVSPDSHSSSLSCSCTAGTGQGVAATRRYGHTLTGVK